MPGIGPPGLPPFNSPVVQGRSEPVTPPWYLFFINIWNRTGGGAGGATLQTGDIKMAAGLAPQPACLICDGAAYSRLLYAPLFSVIGITWGAGDGISTFNVPNTIDGVLVGASSTLPLGHVGTVSNGAGLRGLRVNFYIKT